MSRKTTLFQQLAALYDSSYSASRDGLASSRFNTWRADVRRALVCAFGEKNTLIADFDNLKFDLSDDTVRSFDKRLKNIRIISVEESNVTRIQRPSVPNSAHQQLFEQAMAEARELLLVAKNQLQRNNVRND